MPQLLLSPAGINQGICCTAWALAHLARISGISGEVSGCDQSVYIHLRVLVCCKTFTASEEFGVTCVYISRRTQGWNMETFGVLPVLVLPPLCHALLTPVNVFSVDIGIVHNKKKKVTEELPRRHFYIFSRHNFLLIFWSLLPTGRQVFVSPLGLVSVTAVSLLLSGWLLTFWAKPLEKVKWFGACRLFPLSSLFLILRWSKLLQNIAKLCSWLKFFPGNFLYTSLAQWLVTLCGDVTLDSCCLYFCAW